MDNEPETTRVQVGARVHPMVKARMVEWSEEERRSIGFLVEEMAVMYFGSDLTGFRAGQKPETTNDN